MSHRNYEPRIRSLGVSGEASNLTLTAEFMSDEFDGNFLAFSDI